ncbi:hypothetical protein HMPREF1126_1460 [Streptococcus anginosus SK1138]|uniref:Uncharacterized protein n=1 Tax=Streptococcus anginosus SK1138 TaxID=1161422 RepID=A0AAD2T7X2_STRAP|nr:hypothetical protein HMPREF1126_1460 [Streptococcus anginosus SK1138]
MITITGYKITSDNTKTRMKQDQQVAETKIVRVFIILL